VRDPENTAQTFNQYRALLFSIAYRMLGSATDAEDIVQEAFLRWLQVSEEDVQSAKAYLSAVVVRLCIDQLRSARAQREIYVGPWLPEPISTGQRPELVETTVLAESLSFAFLVMLESLGPLERAVFLLREVFDYSYAEIAAILGKSEANCRQTLHRAHLRLGQRRPSFAVSHEQQERITHQFLRACTNGDMQGLLIMLTDDIVLTTDGGGKGRAMPEPIYGPAKVARGMFGVMRHAAPDLQISITEVNGQPTITAYQNGQPNAVLILELVEERIRGIYLVANPDKLHHLS
jgi:RNA polymerase sigma-70 factor (ECF subfamily)